MKLHLNIEDVSDLYSAIASDKYGFSDNIENFNKITTIMERLYESVKELNQIKIKAVVGENTRNIIMWIFYVDLFYACIEDLEQNFSLSVKQKGNIFYEIHNNQSHNDNEYFRFLRAIIMPHALKLDKQKKFTGGHTAYCPSIFWGDENILYIMYYVNEIRNNRKIIKVPINLLFEYVEDLFENIKLFIPNIRTHKKQIAVKHYNKIQNVVLEAGLTIVEKLKKFKEVLSIYGSVEDKQGNSLNSILIDEAFKLASYDYDPINKEIVDKYLIKLSKIIDISFDKFKKNMELEELYDMVLPECISNKKYKNNFQNCAYEINKIIHEHRLFDDFIKKFFFPTWYSKIKNVISKYVKIDERKMSVEEISLLTIISFATEINDIS